MSAVATGLIVETLFIRFFICNEKHTYLHILNFLLTWVHADRQDVHTPLWQYILIFMLYTCLHILLCVQFDTIWPDSTHVYNLMSILKMFELEVQQYIDISRIISFQDCIAISIQSINISLLFFYQIIGLMVASQKKKMKFIFQLEKKLTCTNV